MKNIMRSGKRFLSLLLAAVMIVGLLPVSVGAEETPADAPEFSAKIVREYNGSSKAYTYTATVYYGETDVTDQASFSWNRDTSLTGNTYTVAKELDIAADEDAKISIAYNGRILKITVTGDKDQIEETCIWDAATGGSAVYGVALDPQVELVSVENGNVSWESRVEEGQSWQWTYNSATTAQSGDQHFPTVVSDANVLLATAVMPLSDGSSVVRPFEKPVSYVVPNISFENVSQEAPGEGEWAKSAQTIRVHAQTDEISSSEYLPPVRVGDTEYAGAWADANGEWTKDVTLEDNGQYTISCGTDSHTVKIDKNTPSISDNTVFAYMGSGDSAHVYFDVTNVGPSSISSILVNGNTVSANDTHQYSCEVSGCAVGDTISIQVTAGNGTSDSKSTTVQEGITLEVPEPSGVVGTKDNTTYLSTGSTHTLRVYISGLSLGRVELDAAESYYTLNGEKVYASSWPDNFEVNGLAFTVDAATSIESLTFSLTDSNGNVTTKALGAYKVDTAAPVVTVSRNAEPVNTVDSDEYFQKKVVYTFTVEDELLATDKSGSAVVTYQYAGEAQQTVSLTGGTATVEVAPGQTLMSLSVSAKDASGNAAASAAVADSDGTGLAAMWSAMAYTGKTIADNTPPQIKVEINDVAGYVQPKNDTRVFAILDPATESTTFIATVTLTDANLDPANLTEWTYNSQTGAYTKSFSSGEILNYYTGSLTIPGLSVTDYALNTADYYDLSADKDSDGELASGLRVATADGITIHFDRRYPSGGAIPNLPAVDFVTFDKDGNEISPVSQMKAGDGSTIDVYNGTLNHICVKVNDTSDTPEHDSGVAQIAHSFSGTSQEPLDLREDGVYTISVETSDSTDETRTLSLQVKDHAENTYTYIYSFYIDAVAPIVTVTKTTEDGTGFIQTVNDVDFYSGAVTYEITAVDTHELDDPQVTYWLEGGETHTLDLTLNSNGTYSCSFTVTDGQELAGMNISVKDINQCVSKKAIINDDDHRTDFNDNLVYIGNSVVVDSTPPAASLEITPSEGTVKTTKNGVDYYDGEIAVTVSVTEKNLCAATLSYIFEDENDNKTVELPSKNDWTYDAAANCYTHTLTVQNGQVLKDIQLKAFDKAEHQLISDSSLLASDPGQTDEDGNRIFSYRGNIIAVDTQEPAVTVRKTGDHVTDYNNISYYNSEVTYAVTVTDQFMEGLEPEVEVTYMDGTTARLPLSTEAPDAEEPPQEGGDDQENDEQDQENGDQDLDAEEQEVKLGETEKFEYLLKLQDGEGITSIRVSAQDNAGQTAQALTDSNVAFSYDGSGSLVYSSSEIVDTTEPQVKIDFSGNVASFYTNDFVAYAKLSDPASGESGSLAAAAAETVTMTITVTDKNLTIDPGKTGFNVFTNIQEDTGDLTINADGTVASYTKSVTVAPDHTGVIMFDLTVHDLAGHKPGAATSSPRLDGTTMEAAIEWYEGYDQFRSTLAVDRRRPTSGDSRDGAAPVVTIVPSISPVADIGGMDLFNSPFSYSLHISDGTNAEESAGLAEISWSLTDGAKAAIDDASGTHTLKEYKTASDITVDVPVKPSSESNALTLRIAAVDNVGNTTTYVKNFAVDNQAPRVNIAYDNNSAVNERYFNADRTITVTVEDINFNPETTAVTTEISGTGWMRSGDVYTAIYSYASDGAYTFDMSCKDLAGNVSGIDFSGGVAPHDFVIDKTAPVINVAYAPSAPAGSDGSVLYYSSEVDVTVTITEQNFNSADVKAEFSAGSGLSGWYDNGENHVASTLFTEGNDYAFSVAYTDLAGNAAVPFASDTFTVDTHAPTIQISQGSMSTDELNIVQGDLELGFAINDQQGNLKDVTTTLIKLDNTFETVELSGDAYYTVRDENDKTNIYVDFANIAKEKVNDGIYIVRITAKDYSGNTVSLSPDLRFSLNRFGSTFTTDDPYTLEFLATGEDGAAYHNEVRDKLIIKEVNPNRVWRDGEQKATGSSVTIVVNGSSRLLEQDVDYTMTVSEEGSGSDKWYVYTYEIDPANFMADGKLVDGRYSILFYGEDEAGNLNTNESDISGSVQKSADGEYSGRAEFTLDCSAPILTILGVEEGRIYNEAYKRVTIGISDSTPTGIVVYVDGQPVALQESMDGLANSQMWLAWDAATDAYVLNLVEQDSLLDGQNIRVVATDAAGNDAEASVEDVLLSTHWLVRLISSPWLIALIVLAAAAVVVFFLMRRKKNSSAAQNTAG